MQREQDSHLENLENHLENQVNLFQLEVQVGLQRFFLLCDEKQGTLCNKSPSYRFDKLFCVQRDLYHGSCTQCTSIWDPVSSLWEVLLSGRVDVEPFGSNRLQTTVQELVHPGVD